MSLKGVCSCRCRGRGGHGEKRGERPKRRRPLRGVRGTRRCLWMDGSWWRGLDRSHISLCFSVSAGEKVRWELYTLTRAPRVPRLALRAPQKSKVQGGYMHPPSPCASPVTPSLCPPTATAAVQGWHDTIDNNPKTPGPCPYRQPPPCMGGTTQDDDRPEHPVHAPNNNCRDAWAARHGRERSMHAAAHPRTSPRTPRSHATSGEGRTDRRSTKKS
jgi:hypothetical protein